MLKHSPSGSYMFVTADQSLSVGGIWFSNLTSVESVWDDGWRQTACRVRVHVLLSYAIDNASAVFNYTFSSVLNDHLFLSLSLYLFSECQNFKQT